MGRVAKKCTQVKVLLLQNNITQVQVKSSHPNIYLSKSKKVLGERTTQVLSKGRSMLAVPKLSRDIVTSK